MRRTRNRCLRPFSFKDNLDRHTPDSARNPSQVVKYPDPEYCTLKFQAHKKQFYVPFYLVCDFESFLSPVDEDNDDYDRGTRVIDEHRRLWISAPPRNRHCRITD